MQTFPRTCDEIFNVFLKKKSAIIKRVLGENRRRQRSTFQEFWCLKWTSWKYMYRNLENGDVFDFITKFVVLRHVLHGFDTQSRN